MRACADGLIQTASECRDVVRPEACERLIVIAARPGEACEDEGAPCVGGHCREERCRRLPRAGQECPDWECQPGLVCDGERCRDPELRGGPCAEDGTCAWALTCLDDRCVARRRAGGACESDGDCAIGTRCEDGACVRADRCDLETGCGEGRTCSGEASARCLAVAALPDDPDAPLPDLEAPCVHRCAGGLGCALAEDGITRCTDRLLAEGAPCTLGWGSVPCAAGLGCAWSPIDDPAAGGRYVCRRQVGLGEDCTTDPCGPGTGCVWGVIDGICVAAICDAYRPFGCGEE